MNIYGVNFKPIGFFSKPVVFVGNSICEVIPYFTTDAVIACTVPPCYDNSCLGPFSTTNADINVEVSIYVETDIGNHFFLIKFSY